MYVIIILKMNNTSKYKPQTYCKYRTQNFIIRIFFKRNVNKIKYKI